MRVWNSVNPPSSKANPMRYYPVKDIEEAMKVIDKEAEKQLKDKSIVANVFGLERVELVDGKPQWCEFYDDDGRDINEIMDEIMDDPDD